MNKQIKNLYKNDKLFKAVFDIVDSSKNPSGIINSKIKKLYIDEMNRLGSISKDINRESVKVNISLELYSILKIKEIDSKFNKERSNNFVGFVKKCLTNILINDYRKEQIRKNYMVYEDEPIEKPLEEFDADMYNRRPAEKPKKPALSKIEEYKGNNINVDNRINSNELIGFFKQFYGPEIIDVLIEANELVGDYSITEAIWAIGKGEQYNSVYKKLRRSRPKFEKFLATKGIRLVDTEHGMYFSYE